VIFGEPVVRAREEKATYLVAREIENVSAPLRMKSLARIEVLIQRGSVETAEAERIGRKMRGNPIEDDADSALME
jgi:hypothetical protein